MADSPRRRYSRSPSYSRGHPKARSRSQSPARSQSRSPVPDPRSQARSRSRSHEREEDAVNHGNTLYVTGLSSRVTERDVKDYFSKHGRVVGCHVVLEPHTRVSRGFAFVTMDTVEEAERCIKYLNDSVMEGRNITVEKSRRGRPRTPTPGSYLGHRYERRERGRFRRGYGGGRDEYYGNGGGYGYGRSPPLTYSSYRESRDYYPSYRESRDYYPSYRDSRDYSPHRDPRDYYESRGSGRGYSPPPYGGGRSRRERSISPYRMPERGYGGGRRAGGGGYDR
ncbi:serine/arginine-rich splicing factor SR45a-like [Miscanthus floridulus]|uniref:serine/arginine-rich splicing factor SR45a-like n=1 Tax=Miscanthus floridulus TaxID=154761 RepID=UPI00345A989A